MNRIRISWLMLAFLVACGYGVVLFWDTALLYRMWELKLNDLGKFYYDARAVVSGQAMYGFSPATEIPVTATELKQFLNLNPPHMHIVLLPLAMLEPGAVLAIWLSSGLLCLAVATWLGLRESGGMPPADHMWCGGLWLTASVALGSILITGQITLHLLVLITWAWLAGRRGYWRQTAVALGLGMSIKPFLLILLPWLALRVRPAAALMAGGVAALCFAFGIAIFGLDNYASWLSALGAIDWYEQPLNASLRGFLSRCLMDSSVYATVLQAPNWIVPLWIAGSMIIGILSFAVILRDRSPRAFDRDLVILLLAASLISPLGWIYYLLLILPPALVLLRRGKTAEPAQAQTLRSLRNVLVLIAAIGLLVPTFAEIAGQPSALLTLTLGSIHFWMLLALWVAAILDGYIAERNGKEPGSGAALCR